ncbi:MAG: hypothetical protein WC729_18665 [Sphingomonas sp.]|jgi:hypothetical protein
MVREIAGFTLVALLMLSVLAGMVLLVKSRRKRRTRMPRLNILD